MGSCSTNDNFVRYSAENISFCLSIPLVLRKIFQHLPNKELRQLSLVDKKWNCEARSVLAKRGSLIANIKSYLPRMNLAALALDLRRMNAAPISLCGINLHIFSHQFCARYKTSPGNLHPIYNAILDCINWRNLSVFLGPDFQHENNCKEFVLVKKILHDKCEDLVEIALRAETYLGEAQVQELFQDCCFPRLKVLKIVCWSDTFEPNFVKALASRAPKLEKFYASAVMLTENILEGSSAVIVLTQDFKPLVEFSPALLNALRPEHLVLTATGKNSKSKDMQRYHEVMPVILQNSRNTLDFVRMDLFFAFPLMNHGVSFVNMRGVMLEIPDEFYSSNQPVMLQYAKALDFTRIFPNLSKVYIHSGNSYDLSVEDINEFAQQGSALRFVPKANQAANIKHMYLNVSTPHDAVKFLAQLFPNIQTLEVQECYGGEIPYGLIWEHWLNLKQIEVGTPYIKGKIRNLDSVFCGIHPEEVAQLIEKDDDYLNAVNIVPVMPAITCLKELRKLNLRLDCFTGTVSEPLMLSKVTYFIAFKKCPNLSVAVTGMNVTH